LTCILTGDMRRVVDSPGVGRLEVMQTGASTGGALVAVIARYRPASRRPPPHYHPAQEERFRILAGRMTAVVDGRTLQLAVGDELVLPPRTVHQFWNAGPDEAAVAWETRPALRTDRLLVDLWSSRNMLQSLLVLLRYRAEVRLAVPGWLGVRAPAARRADR
jgi:mannose-6-phosphate isomerase-like protein (cupin superfamily)